MKFIKKVLCFFVIVILLVYLAILFFLGPIINTATAALGPSTLGAEVKVKDVSVSPLLNSCTVEELVIGNPKCEDGKAWKSDYAFKMGELKVRYELGSVTADQIVIDELVIDGTEVMYETSAMSFQGMPADSNLEHLKMNIDKLLGTAEEDEEKSHKKVWIKKFIFKNAKVYVKSTALDGAGVTLAVRDVEIDDIGKESDGKNVGEAVAMIYDQILPYLLSAGSDLGDSLGEVLKGAGENLKGTGKGLEKAGDSLKKRLGF